MDQPNQPGGRLHLDGDRQVCEAGGDLLLLGAGQPQEPGAAVQQVDVLVEVADLHVPDGDAFVVTLDGVEPGLVQPRQYLLALGTTVHQVADAEQAITSRIEAGGIQRLLQAREMAVDIADGEVAAGGVALEALDQVHRITSGFRSITRALPSRLCRVSAARCVSTVPSLRTRVFGAP